MSMHVTPSTVAPRFDSEAATPRLGLIALSTDLTIERDAARIVPHDRAALYVSRVAFDNPTTPVNLVRMGPRLADAARLILPDIALTAILYGCTAASVTLGDAAVFDAIASVRPGVPVVTPPDAAMAAFAALGVRRIALVTPYLAETTEPMARYFEARGLELATVQCLGVADDRDIGRIDLETIIAAASAADGPDVEAIFLSCTALRSVEVVATIEARLGKPVVSSNLASLWRLLAHADVTPAHGAAERLFSVAPGGARP
jgi:maleate isomerase